jgi:molybdenum cofactor cytidylyltransferase
MDITRALRFIPHSTQGTLPSQIGRFEVTSFVGSGGKTSAIFQLARKIARNPSSTVFVTATSHLGVWQIPLADQHIIATDLNDLKNISLHGVTLVTGEIESEKTKPVNESVLRWLHEETKDRNIPLLVEADGSRQKSLKAPAAYEPPIPDFTNAVIVVAGLSALGKPLTDEYVHRAEIFSQLSGLPINQPVTPDAITRMLIHPQGGLKNIPTHARRIVLLNQADTPELQSIGGSMAQELLNHFDSVIDSFWRTQTTVGLERETICTTCCRSCAASRTWACDSGHWLSRR